nr:hypothetical protein [Tanacetum cinerariifolium]
MRKQPGRKRESNFNSYALNIGGGRGSKGGKCQASGGMGDANGGRGQASGGLGEASVALGVAIGALGEARESSDGSGRAIRRCGRSGRDRGRGNIEGRGRGRAVTIMLVDEEEMNEEEIRKNMEHEYMK